MAQPLRIELNSLARARFITVRTIQSLLWFVNNKALEEAILGYVAKYQAKYGVVMYALVFQGNHFHLVAYFPKCNMAQFMRDLNARIAQLTKKYVKEFIGGPLFERRYSDQALMLDTDVLDRYFYCALQAVNSGLASKITDYPAYNSFQDSASDIRRKYKVISWSEYYERKRYNPKVSIKEFTGEYSLIYTRLPGYEDYSQKAYRELMHSILEEKRLQIAEERHAKGLGFLP